MTIASGADFWLVGNQTVAGLSDSSGTGGKVMCSSGSAATLTLAPPAGTTTFSGTIQNFSGSSGTVSLVVAGTGTQVLAGSNTYSGGTTIQSGALAISNDDNLGVTTGTLTLDSSSE